MGEGAPLSTQGVGGPCGALRGYTRTRYLALRRAWAPVAPRFLFIMAFSFALFVGVGSSVGRFRFSWSLLPRLAQALAFGIWPGGVRFAAHTYIG